MKYLKKFNEINNYEQATLDDVFNECSEFIDEIKDCGKLLYRGVFNVEYDIERFRNSVGYRKPVTTDYTVHTKLNYYFNKIFGWNVRNGAFAYLDSNELTSRFTADYGDATYIMFPVDGYKYCWSPKVTDLFCDYQDEMSGDAFYSKELNGLDEKNIDYWINTELNIYEIYKETDICEAKLNNEISINGDYYLIDLKIRDEIIKKMKEL